MANSSVRQPFPFMQLPSELQISVYEVIFRDIVHQELALSLGGISGPRQYATIVRQIKPLAHTCRTIRRQSTQTYIKIAESIYQSMEREYQECKDLQARMRSLRLPCNPLKQAALACDMRIVNDISMIVKRIEKNIAQHQNNLHITAIESKLVEICTGVQIKLEDGAGLRASFKAEVQSHVGAELTDAGVRVMIKGIASIFAPLRASRRPGRSRCIPRFGLVKYVPAHGSGSKKQKERTYLEDCEHCRIMEELGSLQEGGFEFISTGEILYGVETQMKVRMRSCQYQQRLT